MKRWNMIRILLTAVALVLFSCQAWATPINLDPSLTLQPSNSGDATIQAWLTEEINKYNTDNPGANLPTSIAATTLDVKLNAGDPAKGLYPSFSAGTLSITLPGNLDSYLVLHWGGPGAGTYQVFDLTEFPETSDTFYAPGKYGLSFYSFYGPNSPTPVPEPSTILLLGSGLIGLVAYRKRSRNA
ncbi:MAG: PEP-CTERM sorting domain-containing protein [Syntrophobacteraceae bacterium]